MSKLASEEYRRHLVAIPFTIEAQLQAYSLENDRYELLWHAWKQNKRWLVKLLDLAFSAFPGYSNHDASHADTVLHNIERVLGEERIQGLSASDCFMLLHTAYVHDIGMCITAADRESAIKDNGFNKMLDKFEQSNDPMVREYAEALRCTRYEKLPDRDSASYQDKCRLLNQEKLRVYYALTYALAEYHRRDHGNKAKLRLEELIDSPEKLGGGFSMSGVPMRIFLSIAACAGLHTTWGFSPILELPQEDSGYALDQIHPRFVAVMLQLGDALDLDNDRFHPLMLEYAGNMNHASRLHYDKHKAIRCLQITPAEIFIEASCPSQEVLHLVRQSCDCVENLLKEASYHWAEIVPPEVHGCLPTMLPPKLLINGKNIPKELVTCKFNISQEKAFRLLEGSNLYADEFAFLRELLQNALDAVKLQCWRDYQNDRRWRRAAEEKHENELELLRRLETWRYPVEVELSIVAILEDGNRLYTSSQVKAADEQQKKYTYDVWLELRDAGVGITQDDLDSISKVGTSHERYEDRILQMPSSLRPTGKFGIGLQSVFMVNNQFSCLTHARNEEIYKITFTSAVGNSDGYINVEPISEENGTPYGSTFQIFIPHHNKNDNQNYLSVWSGEDPFDLSDWRDPNLMRAEDLQAQMISYIDHILGEKLFPVCVLAHNGFSDTARHGLTEHHQADCSNEEIPENSRLRHILYARCHDSAERQSWSAEEKRKSLCWGLQEKNHLSSNIENGDVYWLDLECCKLYVWSAEKKVFACFGASRFLSAPVIRDAAHIDTVQPTQNGITVFYKGVRLSISATIDSDMELLEYIDIKDAPTGKILQLSRDEMTKEGEGYLENEIYPAVMDTVSRALYDLTKKGITEEGTQDLAAEVEKRFFSADCGTAPSSLLRDSAEIERRSTRMVSLILLAYFAKTVVQRMTRLPMCEEDNIKLTLPQEECIWEKLLQLCADRIDKELKADPPRWNREFLLVRTFEDDDDIRRDLDQNWRTIAEVLSNRDKYAVVSMRESTRHEWKHSLCRVEVKRAVGSMQGSGYKNLPKSMEILDKKIIYEKFTDYFSRWMLRHIPTAESYTYLSDKAKPGNIRVNLLTQETVKEVYLNDDMKYLLLKKASKRHHMFQASRFSTLVWKGYACLVMNEVRAEICQVDCGFASKACHPNMVLPILGSDIDCILQFGQAEDQNAQRVWEQVNKMEQIAVQWRNFEFEIHALKADHAAKYEKVHRVELGTMDLDTFLSKHFQYMTPKIQQRVSDWSNDHLYADPDNQISVESFFDALGDEGTRCWKSYVEATVLTDYAKNIYIRTIFSEEKKTHLINKLWNGQKPEQQALLEELHRKGRYALQPDMAKRIYWNLIHEMLDCVQTVAQQSFESRQSGA